MASGKVIFTVTTSVSSLLDHKVNDKFRPDDDDSSEDEFSLSLERLRDGATPPPTFPSAPSRRPLHITTDHFPKVVSDGFTFGRDHASDVVLSNDRISGQLFSLVFDLVAGSVVLRNSSRHGTHIHFLGSHDTVRLRSTRYFAEGDTAKVSLLDGVDIYVTRVNDKAAWKEYFDILRNTTASQGSLNINLNAIQTTNASHRDPIFHLSTRLAEGRHTEVNKAFDHYNGKLYAAKVYHKTDLARWEEPIILEGLNHKNIVRYLHYSRPMGQPVQLIMEFVDGDDLRKILAGKAQKHRPLTGTEIRDILEQVVATLRYLHDKGVSHRDIKPSNIMVKSRNPMHIKLIDFGEATTDETFAGFNGTKYYAAPEVLAKKYCTNKVDIFSAGVLALELAYGIPFARGKDASAADCLWIVTQRKRELAAEFGSSPSPPPLLFDLISQMTDDNPSKRPTAGHCLQHDYFVPNNDPEPLYRATATSSQDTAAVPHLLSDRADFDVASRALATLAELRASNTQDTPWWEDVEEHDQEASRELSNAPLSDAGDDDDDGAQDELTQRGRTLELSDDESKGATSSRLSSQHKRSRRGDTSSPSVHYISSNEGGGSSPPPHPVRRPLGLAAAEPAARPLPRAYAAAAPPGPFPLPSIPPKIATINGYPVHIRQPDGFVNYFDICNAAEVNWDTRSRYRDRLEARDVADDQLGQIWIPFEDAWYLAECLWGQGASSEGVFKSLTPYCPRQAGLSRTTNSDLVCSPDSRLNYLLLPWSLPSKYRVLWWNETAIAFLPGEGTVNGTKLLDSYKLGSVKIKPFLERFKGIPRTYEPSGIPGARHSWSTIRGYYVSVQDMLRICAYYRCDLEPARVIAAACGLYEENVPDLVEDDLVDNTVDLVEDDLNDLVDLDDMVERDVANGVKQSNSVAKKRESKKKGKMEKPDAPLAPAPVEGDLFPPTP